MSTYLVICKDGTDPHNVAALVNADDTEVYSRLWNGFTSVLTGAELTYLQARDDVESVTDISATVDNHLVRHVARGGTRWHLEAVNSLQYTGVSTTRYTGAGVHAYVIDSGILLDNPEFEGRAVLEKSWLPQGSPQDTTGHGSSCAAFIGGKTLGVAPGVQLHSLQTARYSETSQAGSSNISDLLSAMEWVAANAIPGSLVNMSLGGPGGNGSLAAAAAQLVRLGFIVVASAGNDRINTFGVEPAEELTIITVGGINKHGGLFELFNYAGVSYAGTNYGTAVDVMAPAQEMESLSFGLASGTSFAAPCVVGLIARFIEAYGPGYSIDIIRDWLVRNGTPGPIDPLTTYRPPIVSSRGL